MSDWIPSQVGVRDHPKTKRASRMLGVRQSELVGCLHFLWYWALEYAPDGDVEDFEPEDLADAADWPGDPELFVNALTTCGPKGSAGFLERVDGRLIIHDWEENQGSQFRGRVMAANRKRRSREQAQDDTPDRDVDVTNADTVTPDRGTVTPDRDLARAKDRPTGPTGPTGQDRTDPRASACEATAPIEDFHVLCPSLPKVRQLTEPRKKRLAKALGELGEEGLRTLFRRVEASDFLSGRKTDWRADLDWILKPEHLTKILEGSYDNRNGPPGRALPQNVAAGLALVAKYEAEEASRHATR